MLLSDAKIRGLKPDGTTKKLNDGAGLVLLIHKNGSRYWQFRYQFAGKEKVVSFGKYPDVSLSEARDRKMQALVLLRDLVDPVADRKKKRLQIERLHRNNFLAVAEEWIKRQDGIWTERHLERTWRRMENHVLPHLGTRPIADIKPLDLLEVIRKLESTGVKDTCSRVLRICSAIFRYAVVTGRIEHNPALNLKGALRPYRENHFPSLRAKEIPEFLEALEALRTSEQNRIAFRMLLLTAVRSGELRRARWEDFDTTAREWRVPAEVMKMREEHIVPLSDQLLSLLSELEVISGHQEWLFPNQLRGKKPFMSENTINGMIKRMGYKGRVVGHGFRSMFSTILNEHGFSGDAIERQLAHRERNKVRAAYNRAEHLPERRIIMQRWADLIDEFTRCI